jgi:hypothetical protein
MLRGGKVAIENHPIDSKNVENGPGHFESEESDNQPSHFQQCDIHPMKF